MADVVASTLASNPVVVFSKTYCPYCVLAKKVLTSVNAKYEVVEIDNLPNGDDIFYALVSKTGCETVPQVFIGGTFIGGGSDTDALQKQGKLVPLLQEAGAL
ncbi:hypothetical protein AC1031_014467 [Aphanomyces cochlioides]|nr:hypothetical protein AC1031_014467 [Aphanomyces cochlioides]